jgi:hypothetical protein
MRHHDVQFRIEARHSGIYNPDTPALRKRSGTSMASKRLLRKIHAALAEAKGLMIGAEK